MDLTAASVYESRLQVEGGAPKALLVPLVLVRNVVLGALGLFGDGVAPATIEVLRRADGSLVGRIPVTSSYYHQERLLAEVRKSLESSSAEDFLATWELSDG